MSEAAPEVVQSGGQTTTAQPAHQAAPADAGKQPPWGDPANFTPEKAWDLIQNLRNEKGDATALRTELDALKQRDADQRTALAKALGVAPEETSQADRLTETVQQLQQQFADQQLKATRLEVAAANNIPAEFQGWLTATDPQALAAQAQQLVPMVQATLAARGQSPLVQPGQAPTAAFQPIPGQGQNPAMSAQQASQAGYAQFYDEHGRPRSS